MQCMYYSYTQCMLHAYARAHLLPVPPHVLHVEWSGSLPLPSHVEHAAITSPSRHPHGATGRVSVNAQPTHAMTHARRVAHPPAAPQSRRQDTTPTGSDHRVYPMIVAGRAHARVHVDPAVAPAPVAVRIHQTPHHVGCLTNMVWVSTGETGSLPTSPALRVYPRVSACMPVGWCCQRVYVCACGQRLFQKPA